MPEKIKREWREFKMLISSVPPVAVALLAAAVFTMNLLANKSISLPFSWMALDCGIVISWLVFLIMDVVTKHFGPKAATELSFFSTAISLFFSLIFFTVSLIPGVWGESLNEGAVANETVNTAINKTLGGTWYIVFGSALAFLTAAAVHNILNYLVGKLFKKNPDSFFVYFSRSYISVAIGQLVDNLVFSLTVSRLFFGWTLTQCFVCALTGMLAELLFQLVFTPIGFKICGKWKRENIGRKYFKSREEENK